MCVLGVFGRRKRERGNREGEMTSLDTCWSMHGCIMCNKEVAPPKVNPSLIFSFFFVFFLGREKGRKKRVLGLWCLIPSYGPIFDDFWPIGLL